MPGSTKLEAIVLRSIRYGEADRILHLLTPQRGRIGAIAKGARRARSRFGGRLEPFSRVALVLHEGRGDLLTVTGADSVDPHRPLREDAGTLDAAARSCDAVLKLFEDADPHPAVYNLLGHQLSHLDALAPSRPGDDLLLAGQLAFRLKLLVAAGLAPQLGACASCGDREHLAAFSGAAGGVVCTACEAGAFPLDEAALGFLAEALAAPLRDAPAAERRVLRQAERAIRETVEHHGHVRLREAAPRT